MQVLWHKLFTFLLFYAILTRKICHTCLHEPKPIHSNVAKRERNPSQMLDKNSENLTPRKLERKKSKRGLYVGIGATATAIAAGTALVLGLNAGPKEDNEPPIAGPAPTETSEPNPTPISEFPSNAELIQNEEWFRTFNFEPTIEDIQIEVEGATPESVARDFIAAQTLISNSGFSEEYANEILQVSSSEKEAVVRSRADELTDRLLPSLLVSNWQSIESLVDYSNDIKNAHFSTLYLAVKTAFPEMSRADKSPFGAFSEIASVQVVEESDQGMKLLVEIAYNDNRDLNSSDEDFGLSTPASSRQLTELTFIIEDGNYKLSDIKDVE